MLGVLRGKRRDGRERLISANGRDNRDMPTKMISDRGYKLLLLICLAVILIGCYFCYVLVYKDRPTAQIHATDQAIEQAQKDNNDMIRRLDEIEDRVQQGAKAVQQRERKNVDSLPPDAVATALVDELRLFLNGTN